MGGDFSPGDAGGDKGETKLYTRASLVGGTVCSQSAENVHTSVGWKDRGNF